MFSLPKLLGLIAILSVVWASFTWGERLSRLRRQRSGDAGPDRRDKPAARPAVAALKPCPVCGVFIAESNPCQRADCVYRG